MTSGDLYKKGSHYFKEKSWKNAIRFFSRAIKLDAEFSDAYIKRGKAYCEQDEPMYNLALLDFNKAVRLKPDDSRIYRARGYAYYMLSKYSKAIGDCNRSLRIDSKQSFLYVVRAMSYLCQDRDRTEAVDDLDQLSENFENEIESLGSFDAEAIDEKPADTSLPGEGESVEGESAEGNSSAAQTFRPLQPSPAARVVVDLDSYENQAWKDAQGADYAALEDLSKAVLLEPEYSYAFWCRGNLYLENSLFDTAIVDYTEAIRLANDDIPYPYLKRGQAYEGKGWFDHALRDYNQAIVRDGSQGEFFWLRGELWESKGEYAKARDDFETAQRLGYCADEEG
ncbi:MAG: tetratricopeptide repeat protein [Planctomycetota bacterium]|nr:tetratricopeptide repeat protein [Planctomycetota bacterium]